MQTHVQGSHVTSEADLRRKNSILPDLRKGLERIGLLKRDRKYMLQWWCDWHRVRWVYEAVDKGTLPKEVGDESFDPRLSDNVSFWPSESKRLRLPAIEAQWVLPHFQRFCHTLLILFSKMCSTSLFMLMPTAWCCRHQYNKCQTSWNFSRMKMKTVGSIYLFS